VLPFRFALIRSAVVQGGIPGAANLGGCTALESVLRRHALKGDLYAAICAAPPLALARWGLLNGVKVIDGTPDLSPVGSLLFYTQVRTKSVIFNLLSAGNCSSGVRRQVPGRGDRRERQRGGRRQGRHSPWAGDGDGVRSRLGGTALREGEG
jgi:hypothetical protein